MDTLTYEVDGRIARITLNRPERGNGITLAMPRELAACVEQANLDPAVHVIALAGNGKGFCGGYDLVESAQEGMTSGAQAPPRVPARPRGPGGQPQPLGDLGPGRGLADDEPQPARLHVAVPLRQADGLQGARLLRGRRHRHGPVQRPARDRRRRAHRLPARAGLGRADLDDVGAPDRPRAGEGPALHRRPDRRRRGARVGPRARARRRRRSSTSASTSCCIGSRRPPSTSW